MLKYGTYCIEILIPIAHMHPSKYFQLATYNPDNNRWFIHVGGGCGRSIGNKSVRVIWKVKSQPLRRKL